MHIDTICHAGALLGLFAALYATTIRRLLTQIRGKRATGRIVRYEQMDGEGRTVYRPIATFNVRDRSYQIEDSLLYGSRYQRDGLGEFVEIRYPDHDPARGCIYHHWLLLWLMTLGGIAVCAYGVWFWFAR